MAGYPLSESAADRWRRLAATVGLRMLLANISVGVLVGIGIAHVRLGLGMPGHKVFLWMAPIVFARVLARHPVGAAAASVSAATVTLGLGGNFAGNLLLLPLVGVAGGIIDACIAFAERRGLPGYMTVALVGFGGMFGGMVCAVKRLLVPIVHTHVVFGLVGVPARLLSYAIFGLLAGLVGATAAVTLSARRRRPGPQQGAGPS